MLGGGGREVVAFEVEAGAEGVFPEDLLHRLGADTLASEQLHGRAAFRCTSPDYLPIVGPLAEHEAFDQAYAVLRKDARQVPDTPCPWLPGLYVNSGNGSLSSHAARSSPHSGAVTSPREPWPRPVTPTGLHSAHWFAVHCPRVKQEARRTSERFISSSVRRSISTASALSLSSMTVFACLIISASESGGTWPSSAAKRS